MATPIPTLDVAGFDKSVSGIATRQFSYYLIADKSQSGEFRDLIASLPHTISIYGSQPQELEQAITNELTRVYNNYFDRSLVDVKVEENSPALSGSSSILNIQIEINLTDKGKAFTLSKLIKVVDSKIEAISDTGVTNGN